MLLYLKNKPENARKIGFCLLAIVWGGASPLFSAEPENLPVDPDSPQAIAASRPAAASGAGWFVRDRFGMMISWGISAVPRTWWNEIGIQVPDRTPGDPSWYFCRLQVPLTTWRNLADRFDPRDFDAESWVKLARDAGMRYIIYIAKHHDGFAMYDSACSTFDVVDATPFKRDPLQELSVACRRHGVRLCLYYSHAQDWEHPDGANNTWDYDAARKVFARYFEQKCKPQVRELLTNYGPIGLVWFDTPAVISPDQSRELYDLVKSLQPECLVNSRIGHGLGDYMSMGDSAFPDAVLSGLWETASTSSHVWFYQDDDPPRMDAGMVIRYLVGNVSRGGNLALNFGPDCKGVIPEKSACLLAEIGRWMGDNGEAVYENGPNPFYTDFEWGVATTRPGFLYLHVTRWPGRRLEIHGLVSRVAGAWLLAGNRRLTHDQTVEPSTGLSRLVLHLPETAPSEVDTVIRLKIDGPTEVESCVVPQQNGLIRLDSALIGGSRGRKGGLGDRVVSPGWARVHPASSRQRLRVTDWGGGYIEGWTDPEEYLSWNVHIPERDPYDVYLVSSQTPLKQGGKRTWLWDGGHEVMVRLANESLTGRVLDGKAVAPFTVDESRDKVCLLGQIRASSPGRQRAELRLLKSGGPHGVGLTLRSLVLVPASRPG